MTKARKKFNGCVLNDFEEYKLKVLKKRNEEIFNSAYEIAKYEAIKNYLVESDSIEIEKLVKMHITNILQTLYEFECSYDYAMWSTWDEIEIIVKDYITENLLKSNPNQRGNRPLENILFAQFI